MPSAALNIPWRVPGWFPNLTPQVLIKLKMFHVELLKFNDALNLVSPSGLRDVDAVHFADCIFGWEAIANLGVSSRIYDFGAGNGFPGLVFGILSQAEIVLVDTDQRKCEFLKHVCYHLELSNVQILNTQIEKLSIQPDSIAVARAFAPISRLVRIGVVPRGSFIVLFKGDSWQSELDDAKLDNSSQCSTWNFQKCGEYSLPEGFGKRALVRMERI